MQANVAAAPRAPQRQALPLLLLFLAAHGAAAELEALPAEAQDPADLFGAKQLMQAVSEMAEQIREDPTGEGPAEKSEPYDGEKDPLRAVSDTINEIKKKADEVVDKVKEEINKTKPLMNRINSMRAQLCWTRVDLWSHKECLKFLGLQCKDGSTGQGVCTQFKEDVEQHCEDDHQGDEDRKVYCQIAKKLGIKVAAEEQDQEESEITEAEEEAEDLGGNESEAKAKKKDRDGDGVPDEEDAFPDDPAEWSDLDGDGIGDNVDEDIDGDGQPNSKDKYPKDSTKWTDDLDGDGHPDKDDAFPDDPKEWGDLDGDGIGDNTDDDIDGDGVPNEHDTHPLDGTKAISDRDGDGHPDKEDAFPDDPEEWKDTDGDGVGDNKDAFPENADCWKAPCNKEGSTPDNAFNKVGRPLPSQGYDEHSRRMVEHKDSETATSDWREEWPEVSESELESIWRICKDRPNNIWCRRFERQLKSKR